jgi:DNA adenine methylase
VHDTRYKGASSGRYDKHEVDDGAHRELLGVLLELEEMVVLSGCPSDLYADLLPGWASHSTSARINAGRGTANRTECLWLNPACGDRISQFGLDLR